MLAFDLAFERWNRQIQTGVRDRLFHFLMAANRHGCSDDEEFRRNARAGSTRTMSRHSRSWECVVAGVGLGMKPSPVFLKAGDVVTLGIDGLGEQRQKIVPAKA